MGRLMFSSVLKAFGSFSPFPTSPNPCMALINTHSWFNLTVTRSSHCKRQDLKSLTPILPHMSPLHSPGPLPSHDRYLSIG